jgi:hypothetical protein
MDNMVFKGGIDVCKILTEVSGYASADGKLTVVTAMFA